MKSWRLSRSAWRDYSIFFLLVVSGVSHACVARAPLVSRRTAELSSSVALPSVAWFAPAVERDTHSLDRWRSSVGPPVTPMVSVDGGPHDAITIVSWNTAVGAADVVRFVHSIAGSERPLVLLLQEVYRGGSS